MRRVAASFGMRLLKLLFRTGLSGTRSFRKLHTTSAQVRCTILFHVALIAAEWFLTPSPPMSVPAITTAPPVRLSLSARPRRKCQLP
jgi:hypothetical protein